MSETQEILIALAQALHDGQIGEEGCIALSDALFGVPREFHVTAFKAFLKMSDN
jgi:hypothetical protein